MTVQYIQVPVIADEPPFPRTYAHKGSYIAVAVYEMTHNRQLDGVVACVARKQGGQAFRIRTGQ